MRIDSLLTVGLLCLLLGCSGKDKRGDADDGKQNQNQAKAPKGSDGNNDSNGAGSRDADEKEAQKQVKKLFGEIQLKEWPLTVEAVGSKLKPELIQKIIGVEHLVTAKKSGYSPSWTFSWANPAKKQSGSVTVSIAIENMPESQMMIQAKVRLNMVKQGFGEEVDELKKYGVVGVHRTKRNTNDLQVCTKSKLIIINAKNMRGRDFKDEGAKKKAAAAIAVALFQD